jgi:hypothetical protein
MNIGTETNSLVNNLYSRMTVNAPDPVVGMSATTLLWTDRHAATVTKVTAFGGVKLWSYEIEVVEDKVTVISGSAHDGSAVFVSVPNPDGYANLYRKSRKTGVWVRGHINRETGRFNKADGGLILGRRDHHIDPSF